MNSKLYKLIKIYLTITIILSISIFFQIETMAKTSNGSSDSANMTKQSTSSSESKDKTTNETIDKLKQIQILKEKIATKVSELRQSAQGAIFGIVDKIEGNSLTLKSKNGELKINLAQDTVFYSLLEKDKKTEIKVKNIQIGDTITGFGIFEDNKKNLMTKYIFLQQIPPVIIGKITDLDISNYTMTIKNNQGNTIFDIEKFTKIWTWNLEKKEWQKSGFSKLKIGDQIHIHGIKNPKDEEKLQADKIYVLTSLISTPTIPIVSSPSATISSN